MSKQYTLKEKAEALAVLKANGGNQAKTHRELGISRRTLRKWENNKQQILSDYEEVKKVQEASTDLADKDAEDKVANAKVGEDYQLAKEHLASTFGNIVNEATQIVIGKMKALDAKEAMWVASTGLDKVLKLKGEPDQIVEVRNFFIHAVIDKLKESVQQDIIDKEQAAKLSRKFDEIEKAEYEEV